MSWSESLSNPMLTLSHYERSLSKREGSEEYVCGVTLKAVSGNSANACRNSYKDHLKNRMQLILSPVSTAQR